MVAVKEAPPADLLAVAPPFNPFAPGMVSDPFPAYAALNRSPDLAWFDETQAWIACRHRHVDETLRSPAVMPQEIQAFVAKVAGRARRELRYLDRVIGAVLFFDTTEEHRSRRRYFVRVLNDRPLSSLEPYLRGLADELLDGVRHEGGFDAVRDFSDVLPRRFMMRLLGIPDSALPILEGSIHNTLLAFNYGCPLAEYIATDIRLRPGLDYLESLVAERRRAPRDDGLSRMVALANEEGADDALVADRAFFLLFAGIETTATLLANSIRLLHEHPGEQRRLKEGEVDAATAVEEFLRYEAPVQLSIRVATRPTTIAGVPIEEGRSIATLIGGANRDPEVFEDPDRLDLSRDSSRHLSFAAGAHFCVGASLARLEGRVALSALMTLPPTRLATESYEWWPFQSLRRVKSLPVEFV